jgi:hypothetical protein
MASPKPQQKAVSGPTGVWIISSKPKWVTSSWLDHRSDSWQFLPDGTCILGTATGTYQMLPDNRLKVQLPTQAATPGFTAVFTFTVSGTALTLNNLAESEPVVLTRGNPQSETGANRGPLQINGRNREGVFADIQGIRTSLLAYYGVNGSYPTSEEGLSALVLKRLMDAVPDDPWGSAYLYRNPGRKNPAGYDLFSAGPDKIPDTSDDDWGTRR